jgi:hypothetical protein
LALPSKVVSLWFWPQLEQASAPLCTQDMDSGLVSNNFPISLHCTDYDTAIFVYYQVY